MARARPNRQGPARHPQHDGYFDTAFNTRGGHGRNVLEFKMRVPSSLIKLSIACNYPKPLGTLLTPEELQMFKDKPYAQWTPELKAKLDPYGAKELEENEKED